MPTALITGGNKGIGKAAARALAKRGFKVWIGARDATRGQQAAAELHGEGFDVSFVQLDVTDRNSIRAAAERIGAETEALDVFVNNAGVSLESAGGFGKTIPPSELPAETLRQIYDVNFFGAVAAVQAFLPLLRKSPAGRIVNVSSELGSFAMNTDPKVPFRINTLGYTSSKAALNMMTVQFAYELRNTRIKINAANPGWIATDLTGPGNGEKIAGRPGVGTPEDGARIVVELATLTDDGPSGGFFDSDQNVLPW